MTLSDVVEKWGITNRQASELYYVTGDVDACFKYACLLYNGVQMEDIRWLIKSDLSHVFKSDDWPVLVQFIKRIADFSGSSPSDILKGLLGFANYAFEPDSLLVAVSYLAELRDRMENEEIKKVPSIRCIRAA